MTMRPYAPAHQAMPRRIGRDPHSSGFTLIELMITLTVLAVVMVVLMTILAILGIVAHAAVI